MYVGRKNEGQETCIHPIEPYAAALLPTLVTRFLELYGSPPYFRPVSDPGGFRSLRSRHHLLLGKCRCFSYTFPFGSSSRADFWEFLPFPRVLLACGLSRLFFRLFIDSSHLSPGHRTTIRLVGLFALTQSCGLNRKLFLCPLRRKGASKDCSRNETTWSFEIIRQLRA